MLKDGKFNYDAFKTFLQFELGVTPKAFIEEQKRELLAARVRDLLRAGVTVSPDEVKAEFLRKNRQVNLEYVRFPARGPGRRGADRRRDRRLRRQERGQAEARPTSKSASSTRRCPSSAAAANHGQAARRRHAGRREGRRAKADALAEKLKKGAKSGKEGLTFAKLARQASRTRDQGARRRPRLARQGRDQPAGRPRRKALAGEAGDIVGPLKGTDGYDITKVEGRARATFLSIRSSSSWPRRSCAEERADAKAKTAADAAVPSAGGARKDAQGPASRRPPTRPRRRAGTGQRRSTAARRGDGAVLAARHARGRRDRGHRRVEPARQGRLRAHDGGAGRGAVRDRGQLVVVRLKERKEPDLAEFEKKKGELDARRGAHEVGAGAHGLDAGPLPRGQASGKRIQVNREELRYEDSSEPPPYEPCSPRRLIRRLRAADGEGPAGDGRGPGGRPGRADCRGA